MEPSKLIKYTLFILLLAVVFFLGRSTKKTEVMPKPTDVSKYERAIDSLKLDIVVHKDSVRIFKHQYDSLKELRAINHKKLFNAIKEIKSFTRSSRERWNDSVLSAAGLK